MSHCCSWQVCLSAWVIFPSWLLLAWRLFVSFKSLSKIPWWIDKIENFLGFKCFIKIFTNHRLAKVFYFSTSLMIKPCWVNVIFCSFWLVLTSTCWNVLLRLTAVSVKLGLHVCVVGSEFCARLKGFFVPPPFFITLDYMLLPVCVVLCLSLSLSA